MENILSGFCLHIDWWHSLQFWAPWSSPDPVADLRFHSQTTPNAADIIYNIRECTSHFSDWAFPKVVDSVGLV